MELKEFKEKIATKKNGQYMVAEWKSEKDVNGVKCVKHSIGVVRMVDYWSLAENKGKTPSVSNHSSVIEIIENKLYFNTNTQNYLVRLFISKNPHHQTKTTYEVNGKMVDKETYETYVKPKAPSIMFNVKLENLISIK